MERQHKPKKRKITICVEGEVPNNDEEAWLLKFVPIKNNTIEDKKNAEKRVRPSCHIINQL